MAVGAPLGAGADDVKEYVVRLGRGAKLALFTDGLVARRGRDLDVGVSDLAATLSFAAGDLTRQACETVVALGRDGSLADDAVLLLASLPAEGDAGAAGEVDVAVVDGVAGLGQARAQARAALDEWSLHPDVVDAVVTVLSELAANALAHGRPPLSVRVRLAYGTVVVEVGDAGGRQPRHRRAEVDDETGRGLELVSLVAARWGSRPTGDGKVVWAEIPAAGR
jgi:signal transduction histidine kinase